LVFLYNVARSLQHGKIAGPNPWDAATLEWSISSPPPVYNFLRLPQVEHRDPIWAEKYGVHEDDTEVEMTIAGKSAGSVNVPDDSEAVYRDTEAHHGSVMQPEPYRADHGVHL